MNNRYWTVWECERKSGNYAAALTFSLIFAVHVALLLPLGGGITVPKGNSPYATGLLAVELRRVSPSAPVWEEPKPAPKDDARKLLAEEALPDSLVVAEPPEPEKPKPVVEKPKPSPAKTVKPLPKQKAVAPPPVPSPTQAVPEDNDTSTFADSLTGSPDGIVGGSPDGAPGGGAYGHPSGQEGVTPDTKGKILTVLLHAVERNKRYPLQARRLGHQGRVTLRVSINALGKVASCALVKRSGIATLDEATEKLGQALIGLDIPPARGRAVEVLIPVQYALKR